MAASHTRSSTQCRLRLRDRLVWSARSPNACLLMRIWLYLPCSYLMNTGCGCCLWCTSCSVRNRLWTLVTFFINDPSRSSMAWCPGVRIIVNGCIRFVLPFGWTAWVLFWLRMYRHFFITVIVSSVPTSPLQGRCNPPPGPKSTCWGCPCQWLLSCLKVQ